MQFSIIAIATFALTALAAPTGGGGNGGSDGCNGPQKTKGCCNTKTVLGVEIISDLLTCVGVFLTPYLNPRTR